MFIGAKMLLSGIVHIRIDVSLLVVALILTISIALSIIKPRK
jgi:predicted tellurium resistance membrane protein TerC